MVRRPDGWLGLDDRFDSFWEAFRKENAQLLLAVRTREVLEWHFKYARLKDRLWVYTIPGDAGLVAYSIFCRQDNPKFGLKRMRLIDFQAFFLVDLLALSKAGIVRRRLQSCDHHAAYR